MNIFRQPSASSVRRLLREAQLPEVDQAEPLQHFFGCGSIDKPLGVVGLEVYGSDALLRSLVVDPSVRGQGCGKALVAQAVPREQAPVCIRTTVEFSSLCPSSAAFMAKDLTGIAQGAARA